MKESIFTENAPKPIGPYSQAIKANGEFIFISGQIPLDSNGNKIGSDIKEQVSQVIRNIQAILASEDCTLENVVKTTVFLKNFDDFASMNEVYSEFFGSSKPARAAFEVCRLPLDSLVEIEAVAVK